MLNPPPSDDIDTNSFAYKQWFYMLWTSVSTTVVSAANSFIQLGAGAVTRTLQDKARDIVSVKDFGAVGDGATDDTIAIQAAITAVGLTGGILYFPAQVYLYTSLTVVKQLQLLGAPGAELRISSGTNDGLIINTGSYPGCVIDQLIFSASVTRTAGAYIKGTSSQGLQIRNCKMYNAFNGIDLSGAPTQGLRIFNVVMSSLVNIGVSIANVSAGAGSIDMIVRDVLISGVSYGVQALAGVQVLCCGDLILDRVSTLFCATGLKLNPPASNVCQSVFVTNSYFDSGSNNGISISPTGGNVEMLKCVNVWSCTNLFNGASLSGTGLIRDVEFSNCVFSNNNINGLYLSSTIATNVRMIGGSLSGNTANGVRVATNVSQWSLIGVTIGNCGQFIQNANYGVLIDAGTTTQYVITSCSFTTNTAGNISNSASGANFSIRSNPFVNDSVYTMGTDVSSAWGIDGALNNLYSITAAGSKTLSTGSGIVAVHNDGTGALALFLCYAGSVIKLGGDATIVAGAPGASQIGFQFNGSTAYKVSNGYATTQNIYITTIKTRLAT